MAKQPSLKAFILAGLGFFIIILGLLWSQPTSVTEVKNSLAILPDNSGKALAQAEDNQPQAGDDQFELVIPSIGVKMPIVFGQDEQQALLKGSWHIPGSGEPDKPEGYKNIVLSGHRYLYESGPLTFFNLEKVAKEDEIIVIWKGREYKYKVDYQQIVNPDDVWILNDDGIKKLTLFTCHPIYTTKQRLVVVAYPE